MKTVQVAETATKNNNSFWILTRKTVLSPFFLVGAINNLLTWFSYMLVTGLTPMRAQLEYGMTPEQGMALNFIVSIPF